MAREFDELQSAYGPIKREAVRSIPDPMVDTFRDRFGPYYPYDPLQDEQRIQDLRDRGLDPSLIEGAPFYPGTRRFLDPSRAIVAAGGTPRLPPAIGAPTANQLPTGLPPSVTRLPPGVPTGVPGQTIPVGGAPAAAPPVAPASAPTAAPEAPLGYLPPGATLTKPGEAPAAGFPSWVEQLTPGPNFLGRLKERLTAPDWTGQFAPSQATVEGAKRLTAPSPDVAEQGPALELLGKAKENLAAPPPDWMKALEQNIGERMQRARQGPEVTGQHLPPALQSISDVGDRLGASPLDLIKDQDKVREGLNNPGSAASLARWARNFEEMVNKHSLTSISAFKLATRNLNNNIGTDIDPMEIVDRVRKGLELGQPRTAAPSSDVLGQAVDFLIPRLGDPGSIRRIGEMMYLGFPAGGLRPPSAGPRFPAVPTVVPPPPVPPVTPGVPPLGQVPPSLRSLVPPGRTIY